MARRKGDAGGGAAAVAELPPPPVIEEEPGPRKELAPGELRTVVLAEVVDSPYQPRKSYDEAYIAELAQSIRANGIQQPPTVRPQGDGPGWELVTGHCRVRAARLLGLEHVEVIVRDLSTAEVQLAQLVENVQRRDLSALDEAQALQRLVQQPGHSVPGVARELGLSESQVWTRLKLLSLIPEAQSKVASGELSASVAILLARVPAGLQPDALGEICAEWRDGPASVREVEDILKWRYLRRLEDAPWSLDDQGLVPEAGACSACPHRSDPPESDRAARGRGAAAGARLCLEPKCYDAKMAAHGAVVVAQARAAGCEVVEGKKAEAILAETRRGTGGYVAGEKILLHEQRKVRTIDEIAAAASAAGDDTPLPTIAVDEDGAVHRLYPKKAAERMATTVRARLEARKAKPNGKGAQEREAERTRKAAAEEAARKAKEAERRRKAALGALLMRAGATAPAAKHWHWLIATVARLAGMYQVPHGLPLKLDKGTWTVTRTLSPAQAFAVLMVLVAADEEDLLGDDGEALGAACALYGIDVAALEAEKPTAAKAPPNRKAKAKGKAKPKGKR